MNSSNSNRVAIASILICSAFAPAASAQVPQLINYQGRVSVGAASFSGTGQFKFALVNAGGTVSYWSNDGTSAAGSQPAAAVPLTVSRGLYSVLLGDASLPNMTVVPAAVFTNPGVHLRVWFSDGVNGSQLLSPDQRIAAVGYAMMAADVPDSSISAAKLAPGAAAASLGAANQSAVASGGVVLSATENPALVSAGYVRLGVMTTGDAWQMRTGGAGPDARTFHTSVWTGTELIIWGGYGAGGAILNTGGRYNPATGTWRPVSMVGAPAARYTHTAVWSGSEMIVWGGQGGVLFTDGGRYDPVTDSWKPLNTSGAPSGRYLHTAVWAGTEMIVWGGTNGSAGLNTGGRYNPVTNTWAPTSMAGVPGSRRAHTAIWSGTEMIVFGGFNGTPSFSSGGRYNPATDVWSAMADFAPDPNLPGRQDHTAVWTGTEMIVWGGIYYSGSLTYSVGDPGRYNPTTNQWTTVSAPGAPSVLAGQGASHYAAVWTGTEMISLTSYDGGRYSPVTDRWTPVTRVGAPVIDSAVWTGSEVLVWGATGDPGARSIFSYSPGRVMVLYQRP